MLVWIHLLILVLRVLYMFIISLSQIVFMPLSLAFAHGLILSRLVRRARSLRLVLAEAALCSPRDDPAPFLACLAGYLRQELELDNHFLHWFHQIDFYLRLKCCVLCAAASILIQVFAPSFDHIFKPLWEFVTHIFETAILLVLLCCCQEHLTQSWQSEFSIVLLRSLFQLLIFFFNNLVHE